MTSINITLTEGEARSLKKTVGIATANMSEKVSKLRPASDAHATAQTDLAHLYAIERKLIDGMLDGN
jgi:hypothetical protein